MAENPEALAQIARLIGEPRLREAAPPEVQSAVDGAFAKLVGGIVSEAEASDDVTDRESALAFMRDRVRFLESLLRDDQRERLLRALAESVASW